MPSTSSSSRAEPAAGAGAGGLENDEHVEIIVKRIMRQKDALGWPAAQNMIGALKICISVASTEQDGFSLGPHKSVSHASVKAAEEIVLEKVFGANTRARNAARSRRAGFSRLEHPDQVRFLTNVLVTKCRTASAAEEWIEKMRRRIRTEPRGFSCGGFERIALQSVEAANVVAMWKLSATTMSGNNDVEGEAMPRNAAPDVVSASNTGGPRAAAFTNAPSSDSDANARSSAPPSSLLALPGAARPAARTYRPPSIAATSSEEEDDEASSSEDEEDDDDELASPNRRPLGARNAAAVQDRERPLLSPVREDAPTPPAGPLRKRQKVDRVSAGLGGREPRVAQPAEAAAEEDGHSKVSVQLPAALAQLLQDQNLVSRLTDALAISGSSGAFIQKLEDSNVIEPKAPAGFIDSEDEVWSDNEDDGEGADADADAMQLQQENTVDAVGIEDLHLPVPPQQRQGSIGYNLFLVRKLRAARVPRPIINSNARSSLPLLPHQQVVTHLFENGYAPRLLLDHQTGSGKTRSLIELVSADYDRSRTKVLIVPKKSHVDNLMKEFLKFPNKWRTFFAASHPDMVVENWAERLDEVWEMPWVAGRYSAFRDCVGLKGLIARGRVNESWRSAFVEDTSSEPPAAPLRIFNFSTAGGRAVGYNVQGVRDGKIDACLRFRLHDSNPYAGKLVICDEAHNLLRPSEARFAPAMRRLRTYFQETSGYGAWATWLYLLSATPAQPNMPDRALLDVLKGEDGKPFGELPQNENEDASETSEVQDESQRQAGAVPPVQIGDNSVYHKNDAGQFVRNDEGYISLFQGNADNYPRVVTPLDAEKVVGSGLAKAAVKTVKMHGRSYSRYTLKDCFDTAQLEESQRDQKLGMYTVSAYPPCAVTNNIATIRRLAGEIAPKLQQVIQTIRMEQKKSLVLVARRTGYMCAKFLLTEAFGERLATLPEIHSFNCTQTNLRGTTKRVMLATLEECSEGVEFIGVRHYHVVDMPQTSAAFEQICGRPVRVGSHNKLPHHERDVEITLYEAKVPRYTCDTKLRRIAALSKSRGYRDSIKAGLRLWEEDDEAPKGVMPGLEKAPKKTVDADRFKKLKKDIAKSRKAAINDLRAFAVDYNLYRATSAF